MITGIRDLHGQLPLVHPLLDDAWHRYLHNMKLHGLCQRHFHLSDAELELAEEKPRTEPPKFNIAASKLSLVHGYLVHKKVLLSFLPSHAWLYFCGLFDISLAKSSNSLSSSTLKSNGLSRMLHSMPPNFFSVCYSTCICKIYQLLF